ncbi:hypothetical protein NBRC116592_01360 [Colwellia sp. KU-HH00111]|uniref:exosortase/archaeosortase family protein n=1 Tax=Colwellia sp. KU-HH00111 TaxID=3127652 RepID=UPI003105E50C
MSASEQPSVILAFFPRFITALIGLQLAVLAIHSSGTLSAIVQSALTKIVAMIHTVLGSQLIVQDNMLIHQGSMNYVIVDNECTGLMLLASVCAAIIGFAKSIFNALKMIIIAVIILQTENIVRITHLVFVIEHTNENFDFYHLYFWQAVNFITGLAILFILERKFN